jgi:hypothetical protein
VKASKGEAIMICIRISAKPLVLVSGIGIAVALAGPALAAAPPSSAVPSPSIVVIRGATDATLPSSGDNNSPVVLRGSPPSPVRPPLPAASVCPAGYLYDPSYGCTLPGSGYAYAPYDYDYDYWPYWGWGYGGYYAGNRQHRFPYGFAGRSARGRAVRFGHPAIHGFGHGFAHAGGFGHGFAHAGGFGHR